MVEFPPTQLKTGGHPTVTIRSDGANPASIDGPQELAFDRSGDLWVDDASDTIVVKFKPTQLTTSGDPAPAVILSPKTQDIYGPTDIAFDAAGDLWVGNLTSDIVDEFAPTKLEASGNPTAHKEALGHPIVADGLRPGGRPVGGPPPFGRSR